MKKIKIHVSSVNTAIAISLFQFISSIESASLVLPTKPHSHRLFEGDIAGIDVRAMTLDDMKNTGKSGVMDEKSRWNLGIVPYEISDDYEDHQIVEILKALKGFDDTCVRFIPRSIETDYLLIAPGLDCHSHVGKQGGLQPVILNAVGCLIPGLIQHELMHSIGFWHEQSREDRDNYVDINFANIKEEDHVQFKSYLDVEYTAFGEPYDFSSVMHYGKFDFSINHHVWTIRPKPAYRDHRIGQRRWMSESDIKKINLMYSCKLPVPSTTATTTTTISATSKI